MIHRSGSRSLPSLSGRKRSSLIRKLPHNPRRGTRKFGEVRRMRIWTGKEDGRTHMSCLSHAAGGAMQVWSQEGSIIAPQPGRRENVCGAPPQTALVTRGRGVRKPIDRLLWPLALGAWTYATGSPTPKGLGSSSERPAALTCLSGFRHPRTVRTRPTSIIGHTSGNGNRSVIPVSPASP